VLYFAVYPSPDLRPLFFAFVRKAPTGSNIVERDPRQQCTPSDLHEAFSPKTAILSQVSRPARPEQRSVSPLAATLTEARSSVGNKRLTGILTPLDATLAKKRGEGTILTFQSSNVESCSDRRSISFTVTFLATPLTLKPYPSISYKNHRGWGSIVVSPFPIESMSCHPGAMLQGPTRRACLYRRPVASHQSLFRPIAARPPWWTGGPGVGP
jgi:hypothetical protein